MSGFDLIEQGGFIMYPLLVFSVLAWAIAIYKYVFLKSFTDQMNKFETEFKVAVASNKNEELKKLISNTPPIIGKPHDVIIDDIYSSKDEMNEKLNRRITETNAELKKGLWVLGTIGSSAPFVGLFGTVMGIMDSFKSIGSSGKSGFSIVAAGISEALIATAAGIIVAVVAVIFYNYFQIRVNSIAQSFRNKVEDAAETFLLKKKLGK
jgi:biopolymer transport protein ExbB/TolQ